MGQLPQTVPFHSCQAELCMVMRYYYYSCLLASHLLPDGLLE